ncbi:class I lanthipeptide [Sphingobacterium corticibacterium]|uniref:Uncharacterized protein n=1 Tax=Sphingobacterium corticibacterium TaxID=2484746 RepID=A0A4Q6XUE0_9SPHI|nr:class I lanthipeptide [Sphingobacterium corticibacterium]RZF60237.1 hypothetical protein EWE74_14110 [Sphingobacterium corticibacterium]
MKKLKLNKTVISNLTREEAGQIVGGGITDGCQTLIHEGCPPGGSWDNCSNACTDACYGYTDNPAICANTGLGATCSGCQTDYGCPPLSDGPYTVCGTVC